MYLNISYGVQPWISWSDTHFNYSQVDQYPALLWQMNRNSYISLELSKWLPVFCAAVFFCFFGFAEEARRNYGRAFGAVARLCPFKRPSWMHLRKGFVNGLPFFTAPYAHRCL